MLVALAVTLVMMAAVVNLFANISGSIRNRRAVIEVSGQLRQVRQQLALDLAGATCTGRTWQRAEHNPGYIEIIEGLFSDMHPSVLLDGDPGDGEIDYTTSLVPSGGDPSTDLTVLNPQLTIRQPQPGDVTNGRALGDWDDVLALTVQSEATPFRVQVGGNMVESNYAEVVWFAAENPQDDPTTPEDERLASGQRLEPGLRRIYRRVFLIDERLGPWDYAAGQADLGRPANVSVRFVPDPTGTNHKWVANSLSDLTRRENRIARNAIFDPLADYPYNLNRDLLFATNGQLREYLVLDDALAFDVRVYEPGAPLLVTRSGSALQPGDPGWPAAAIAARTAATLADTLSGFGAYVDLGWAAQPAGSLDLYWPPDSAATFSAPMMGFDKLPVGSPAPLFHVPHPVGRHPRYNLAAGYPAAYDTWSFHYENDRVNQDLNQDDLVVTNPPDWRDALDQATNSLDDDGINGVNDPGERETSPPYDVPLRGVRVSLRIYERDARQIRETSVTHAFAQ
jgi:hypothetical protein